MIDIKIRRRNHLADVIGVSVAGKNWIDRNILVEDSTFVIPVDCVEEMKEAMEKATMVVEVV